VIRRLRDRLTLGWSEMPLRLRGLVVVAIPVIPLVLTALLFIDSAARQARAEAEVRSGLQVERDMQRLLAVLFDGESGVRAYLLTGDASWLGSYDVAREEIPVITARLTKAITTPEQKARFAYARDLIEQRVDVLRQLRVAASEEAIGSRGRSQVLIARGRELMDRIRAEFALMQGIQDRAFGERAERVSRARRATLAIAAGGAGMGVIGGIVAAVLFTAGIGRAEGKLHESVAELDRFFSLSPDMLCIAGTDGYFKRVNGAWTATLQWPEAELLAMPYLDLVHPDDRAATMREAQHLADGSVTVAFENRYRARDGGYHRLEWKACTIPDSGIIYAAARDVTQQRITEGRIRVLNRELGMAKDFLEELIAASPSIVFRFLPNDLTLTYVSPNVGWLLGYSAAEMVGVPGFWEGLIHPEDREGVLKALKDAPELLTTQVEQEYRVRGRDGRYRWFYTLVRLEYGGGGEVPTPIAVLGYALDIADRKAAEEAARNARLEAERANRAKSEFLSRMSHDLRTPLNAIIGFAQLVELEARTADERDAAVQIIKGGRHLLGLINEVLDLARIEAGQLTLSPEPVGIHELVNEALNLVMPLALARDIRLEADTVPDRRIHVLADRQRLAQVLLNLLSNAVKYNRDGGRVTVTCRTADDSVQMRVSDTGPGIRPEQLSRLFTPFDRLDAGQAIEGTGLGLALCQRLAEAMGGRMGVESEPGRGSTFWIELPVIQASAAPAERTLPAGAREANGALKGTVLYVEDNPSNLRLIERIMARRPGVTLLSAMQGGIGVELARSRRPDLIFLDMHLPDISGAEVLHRLRAQPETANIPVAILSADATERQIERQLAAGARAYLTKPLNVAELLALVDETLAARRANAGDATNV
jgi:PAS domain S-box-containing protein